MGDMISLIQLVVFVPLGWLWMRLSKLEDKLNSTFTKEETKEIIDLKNRPIVDAVDRNTRAQEQLAAAIQDLRIDLMKKVDV